MRMPLLALAGLGLAACQPESDKNNPAVATDEAVAEREAAAPAAGANSFTEEQARQRIEAAGYANVTGLTQELNGVWRADATIGGQVHTVILDYQGNISTEGEPVPADSASTPPPTAATPPGSATPPTPAQEPNQ